MAVLRRNNGKTAKAMEPEGFFRGPVRTCTICGCKASKEQLCRFVWQGQRPVMDVRKRMMGRGAYCCDRERCVDGFLAREKKWKIAFRL